MLPFLRSISLALFFVLSVAGSYAQDRIFTDSVGATNKYSAMIELPKAYLSGVCIMKINEGGKVTGCLFNEFGISALEFTYRPGEKKAKLMNVIRMMDKWYIKRVISRDLANVYQCLLSGQNTYQNKKHHITYRFTPMQPATNTDGCEDVHNDLETTQNPTDATKE